MTWTTQPRSKRTELATIEAGKGPRIVLIHGVGLRSEAWALQIAALSADFETVAVDLPGHGESPLLQPGASLTDFTDAVAGVLTVPSLIVGHSMGGMIALDLAARFPNRVSGVAALNAVFERSPKAQSAVIERADSLDGTTVADPTTTLTRWFGSDPSPTRDACADWLTHVNPAGYAAAYGVFAHSTTPSAESLQSIVCPALFMTGQNEPNSTPEMAQRMAALAPQGEVQIVVGAAHMMPMTHAETVNAALHWFAHRCLP